MMQLVKVDTFLAHGESVPLAPVEAEVKSAEEFLLNAGHEKVWERKIKERAKAPYDADHEEVRQRKIKERGKAPYEEWVTLFIILEKVKAEERK